MKTLRPIFLLAGIALIIVGANTSSPLVIVGPGLIVLAFFLGGHRKRTNTAANEDSSGKEPV